MEKIIAGILLAVLAGTMLYSLWIGILMPLIVQPLKKKE